jgi:DNA-binding NtrC family response regulator
MAEFAREYGRRPKRLDSGAATGLRSYRWPGNVRELRNVIERATILAEGEFIELKHLPPLGVVPVAAVGSGMTLEAGITVEEAERRLIVLTLEHTRDNKTRAAEILGISLKTLHNKLNRLGLRKGL